MRVLLDHCVDRRLRRLLPGHQVRTAYEMGWATLKNGKLLDEAAARFDVFVITDQNLPHQQSLAGRSLAVIILVAVNNRFETLAPLMPAVASPMPTAQA